jgi:RNA polymerase sigma-70 factor (ECF subfamily)
MAHALPARAMPSPTPDAPLSALFRAHAPPGVQADQDDAPLALALRRLFEAGRQAWPAIELSPEAFVRQLAERGAAGPLGEVRAADLYLACACAARIPGAIEAFDGEHLRLVGAFLSRLRPSAAFVDDVRQTLREKLFVGKDGAPPRIAEYNGRAAPASWLRVIAVRAAIDLQRASKDAPAESRDEERPPPGAAGADPEMAFIQQRYRAVFNDALRDAVGALDADHREILRLHFVEGRTLDQLAASLHVHRATIARRLKAAREAVLGQAHRRLEERLGARHAELESLAGVMLSQLDLSLPRLLRPRGA